MENNRALKLQKLKDSQLIQEMIISKIILHFM